MEEIKCELCGKTFKSESGLSGHMRLSHDEQRIKTTPDKIGERLQALELAAATNSRKNVDTEEGLITTLKILLPAMERYGLAIVNFGKRTNGGWISDKKYQIIKNSDIEKGDSIVGGGIVEAKAKEF